MVILTLSSYLSDAEVNQPDPEVIQIENWHDMATDETTFLDVEGYVYANVYWRGRNIFRPKGYWQLESSAYADTQAAPMGQNTEYKATAWVEATVDTKSASIPGRGNINTNRQQWDSEGRDYNYDSHGDQYSQVAYKKHPVSSTVKNWWEHFNPWAEQVERWFSLSIYCYISKTNGSDIDDDPMNLTADPHMHSYIEGSSMQYLGRDISSATISSP